MRGGLYAALLALNFDPADFDCDCDVRQRAVIKPRIAKALYVTGLSISPRTIAQSGRAAQGIAR